MPVKAAKPTRKKTSRATPAGKPGVRSRRKPVPVRTRKTPAGRRVRASYDAAQVQKEHANHWAAADALNANAANNPATRKTLRERARYERDNNGYCGGLVERVGNDLVGTCPRLQLTIPGVARDAARQIERAFAKWAKAVNLGGKLRLLDNAAVVDGEGFALLVTNRKLDPMGVQLDLRLYETDQVETPLFWNFADPLAFSGGRLDETGNVTEWHFLKVHPGSDVWTKDRLHYDPIPAPRVLHWFKARRAGQIRGVPEILSSLSLYAYLRRYTLATVAAAEVAANLAGVLETGENGPAAPTDDDAPTLETMDEVELARGMLLTLPPGWKASQFRPEQPVNTYSQFKGEVLSEAGATLGAPRNVSTGSSAEYNYSSGRLDIATLYRRGVDVRRNDLCDRILDRIGYAWLSEAAVVPRLFPAGLPPIATWGLTWRFDGFAAIDPMKEANANDTRLRNGSATLAGVVGDEGGDWEEHLEQLAAEESRRKQLGLPALLGSSTPTPSPAQQAGAQQDLADAASAA